MRHQLMLATALCVIAGTATAVAHGQGIIDRSQSEFTHAGYTFTVTWDGAGVDRYLVQLYLEQTVIYALVVEEPRFDGAVTDGSYTVTVAPYVDDMAGDETGLVEFTSIGDFPYNVISEFTVLGPDEGDDPPAGDLINLVQHLFGGAIHVQQALLCWMILPSHQILAHQ